MLPFTGAMAHFFHSTRIGFVVCVVAMLAVLASCSPPQVAKPNKILRPNTVTTIKAFGEYFRSELVKIKGDVVIWNVRWEEQIVSSQKLFQNIFPVSISEGDASIYNEFDHTQLEALFPLSVGGKVVFEGLQYRSEKEGGVPFWAMISVVGTDTIELQGKVYNLFIIEVVTDTLVENTLHRSKTTHWHAKDLGINLITKYQTQIDGGTPRTLKVEVVELIFPDELYEENKNVGITRINYENKELDKDNDKIVLNEAQF